MIYLEAVAAEIRDAVPSGALPPEDTTGLFLVYAVLLLAKGEDVTGEDVHNAWVAWAVASGKRHESMVPYADLPPETKAEDSPYAQAIRSMAKRHATAS